MKNTYVYALLIIIAMFAVAACGEEDSPPPTNMPTAQATDIAQQPTDTATPGGPTLTASPTFRPTATLAPPSATIPPNPTALPTDTPPPWDYVVQEGDTCGEIAVFYDVSVEAIEQANNLSSCRFISPGQRLTIPRPTLTPTPFGLDVTETAVYEALPPLLKDVTPFAIYEYCAVEEDTITSIAIKNGTTNRRLCELNPLPGGLDCRGCDFSESAVGSCPNPPLIGVGQCYQVPGPTYTPPPSATPAGSPTITATPTHIAPQPFYPTGGTMVTAAAIRLMWTPRSGVLLPNELYAVTVVDEATQTVVLSLETTRTDVNLPDNLRPASGQQITYVWSVQIVVLQGDVVVPVSGRSPTQRFVWQAP